MARHHTSESKTIAYMFYKSGCGMNNCGCIPPPPLPPSPEAFALLLIGAHEMIDYFSGADTDIFAFFWPYKAYSGFFFLIKKRTGQVTNTS